MFGVKCVETGTIYDSAAEAARATGVTPGAITHVLKGRMKTCGGHTWARVGHTRQSTRAPRRVLRDDAGHLYGSYRELAFAKGMTVSKVHGLMRNADVFLNEWLTGDPVTFYGHEPRNATYRPVPTMLANKAIDKAQRTSKSVTVRRYRTGWAISHDDLFGEM